MLARFTFLIKSMRSASLHTRDGPSVIGFTPPSSSQCVLDCLKATLIVGWNILWICMSISAAGNLLIFRNNFNGGTRSSHPASPNYGKHWTSKQVADTFAPSEETVKSVREWLISSGISSDRIAHSDNKGWFAFNASIHEAENLLKTQYHQYEDSETGHSVAACEL